MILVMSPNRFLDRFLIFKLNVSFLPSPVAYQKYNTIVDVRCHV